MLRRTCTAIVALLLSTSSAFAQAAPLRIYVFAHQDPSGLVDSETRTRQRVAAAVAGRLRDKREMFSVVPSASDAEATLEVTDVIAGDPQNNAFWIGLAGVGNIIHARRAVLTMGDYRTGFAARSSTAGSGLAQLVIDWAKMNRAKLAAR